jgi:hypothetical protein
MTKKELLDSIESLLININILISKVPSENEEKELDDLAGKLDKAQNRLVKLMIRESDAEYLKLAGELGKVNSRIKQDLTALETLGKALEGVKQAVALISGIVELCAVAAGKV